MEKIIQKLEKKLTKWRNTADHKKTALFFLVLFTSSFIYSMEITKAFKINKNIDNDNINRAAYDAAEYIKNVETLLVKMQITSTSEQSAKILAEIWKQSNLAKGNIVELPSNQQTVENASNFLSQLSDYSYMLMKKTIEGNEVTDKEYEELSKMQEYAKNIRVEFSSIVDNLNSGKIKWGEVEKALASKKNSKENKVVEKIATDNVGKVFQDYQGLIYDGAFSNHILNIKPTMLLDQDISIKDGIDKINKLYGKNNIESVKFTSETKGNIETYGYAVKLTNHEETIDVEITKDSGYILWILTNKDVTDAKLSIEEAKKKGKEFLEKLGYKDMKDTYYSVYENMATINYAYKQEDCVMYPDLIKVKVALDDGFICSMESHGYIFNHKENRSLNTKISKEEASLKINPKLKIESSNLAYIPTEAMKEKLVYEFKGVLKEKYFLVYIDANTGVEEKILLIIDSDKGMLTM